MARFVVLLVLLWPTVVGAAGPPPDSIILELPFLEEPRPGRVLVDLAPVGSHKPRIYSFDPGFERSFATQNTARSLGIVSGKHETHWRRTRLGHDMAIYVSARLPFGPWLDHPVLGNEHLFDHVVEIDFGEHRLRIIDAERFEVPARVPGPEETVVPLAVRAHTIYAKVLVDREETFAALSLSRPPPLIVPKHPAETLLAPGSSTTPRATRPCRRSSS